MSDEEMEPCPECGDEDGWCECRPIEEPEPMEPGMIHKQSTQGMSFKFFTL